MPPKKPTLSAPSRPDSGSLQLAATGNSVSLKVPSPPPDRPLAAAKTRRTGPDGAPTGTTQRAGSRARRVQGTASTATSSPTGAAAGSATMLGRRPLARDTALRPGIAAALASRTTEKLWSTTPTTSATTAPVGSAARVGRLLRDARAAVRAPVRPETPADYLQPGLPRRRSSAAAAAAGAGVAPRPPPGRRLAALKPLDTTTMLSSQINTSTTTTTGGSASSPSSVSPSSAAAAAAMVRNSQLVPEVFLAQLIQAEGDAAVQIALLRELHRWLSNPTNRLWPALVAYFGDFFNTAVDYPSADRRADVTVGALMGGILLRNTTDVLSCDAVAAFTRLLRTQVQGVGHSTAALHLSSLLEKEALFEPLFYVLRSCCGGGGSGAGARLASDDVSFVLRHVEQHTSVALDVLEVLRGCTTTYAPETTSNLDPAMTTSSAGRGRRSSGHWAGEDVRPVVAARSPAAQMDDDAEDTEMLWRRQAAQAERVCEQLATSGLLPTLNALLHSLLTVHRERPDEDIVSGMLLPSVCLLLRNLASSARQAGHLCRLGTLELLLQVLEGHNDDVYVMEACSRALAKLVFVPECLAFYQQNTRLVEAAVAALLRHTEPISEEAMLTGTGSGTLSTHVKMLVARLCSTIARVVEGRAEQLEALAKTCSDALVPRLVDYFVTRETVHVLQELHGGDGADGETAQTASHGASTDASHASAVGALRRRRGSLDALYSEGLTDTSLLEGVVWLVGLIAMSPLCTTQFVRTTAPALTELLKALELGPTTRLTCVYTLMALSNLSYFFSSIEQEDEAAWEANGDDDADDADDAHTAWPSPFLAQLYEVLGLCLAGFLFEGDAEATVEATRVLGNMSFTNTGRDWMETNKCDEVMVVFLGHEDLRIVYNCFGVLLNLTAATHCRVVEDAELLRMLLQNTGRYTRQEDINLAAKEEKRLLLQAALRPNGADSGECDDNGMSSGSGAGAGGRLAQSSQRPLLTEKEAARLAVLEAQELATGYAAQIAELVEKVLQNVYGLILAPSAEADADDEL